MDPVTLIVAAVVAGAASGLGETATDAVKDAYSALKRLLQRAFGDDADAAQALEKLDNNRTEYKEVLAAQVRATGADKDKEVLLAAEELLKRVDPSGANAGKYNIKISGGQVGAIGDDATVTIGQPPPSTGAN
jgi:ABC-type oligopeptide transport system ATPase subunit